MKILTRLSRKLSGQGSGLFRNSFDGFAKVQIICCAASFVMAGVMCRPEFRLSSRHSGLRISLSSNVFIGGVFRGRPEPASIPSSRHFGIFLAGIQFSCFLISGIQSQRDSESLMKKNIAPEWSVVLGGGKPRTLQNGCHIYRQRYKIHVMEGFIPSRKFMGRFILSWKKCRPCRFSFAGVDKPRPHSLLFSPFPFQLFQSAILSVT